jgi:hypothetical protein
MAATEPGAVIPKSEPLPVAQQQQPQQSLSNPPVKRFFHAMNSSAFIHSDGLAFSFSPYLHAAGTWFGTYATEKADEIAALVKLVGKRIEEIPLAEWEACQKKKAQALQSLGQSLIHSEVSSDSRPSVKDAVPLNTEPLPPLATAQPVIAGAESLSLGESKAPDAAAADAPTPPAK